MHPVRTSFVLALVALAAAGATAAPARAAQYFLTVDVPTTLGGIDYTTSQILRATGGAYVVEGTFPDGLEFAAIDCTASGPWLLVPAFTVVADVLIIETRDVFRFDVATEEGDFVLDGSAAGIPDYAAIDALYEEPSTGRLVLSFDVPVLLGGVEYGPSDLVGFDAGFSLVWSGAAAGVPSSANVVGADRDASGRLVLTFDVPVAIGGTTYLPGQLVRWDSGTGFSLHTADPGWPPSSVIAGFGFLPAAGVVPDGSGGSVPVTVTPAPGGAITLSWAASCAPGDSDYAVYEGTLGGPPTSHVPITCSTAGATSWTFTPGTGNRYYYVVPRNAASEGSYGHDSEDLPRLPSAAACLPQEVMPSCG